jgi:hypothetical protein
VDVRGTPVRGLPAGPRTMPRPSELTISRHHPRPRTCTSPAPLTADTDPDWRTRRTMPART